MPSSKSPYNLTESASFSDNNEPILTEKHQNYEGWWIEVKQKVNFDVRAIKLLQKKNILSFSPKHTTIREGFNKNKTNKLLFHPNLLRPPIWRDSDDVNTYICFTSLESSLICWHCNVCFLLHIHRTSPVWCQKVEVAGVSYQSQL